METFHYRAIDQVGQSVKGIMEAANVADLEMRLQQMGLDLTTVKTTSIQPAFLTSRLIYGRVDQRDLIMFCFQLEQVLKAGIPILEGLYDLKENTAQVYFKRVLGAVFLEVDGGKMLSEALSAHPHVFDAVFVSLIAAGEQSGQLPTVLHQLSQTLKWQSELFAQTKRLLLYPLLVVTVVTLAIIFLMVFLVPELVKLMNGLGQALPWSTQVLIAISDGFVQYWWLIISLLILIALIFTSLIKRSQAARHQFDGVKLKLPVVGPVLKKMMMARFARYFALMYGAGIPVLSAIKTCERIVGNQVISIALSGIHDRISAGHSMRDSFQQAGLFPSLVIRMVSVGERSGALEQALMNISYFYDRDVDERLQGLLKLLEPVLTVVLGLILMFVMAAVLGPVYNAFSQMPL